MNNNSISALNPNLGLIANFAETSNSEVSPQLSAHQALELIGEAYALMKAQTISKDFYLKVIQGLKKIGESSNDSDLTEIANQAYKMQTFVKAPEQKTAGWGGYLTAKATETVGSIAKVASWTKDSMEYYLWNSDQPWKQRKHAMAIETLVGSLQNKYGTLLDQLVDKRSNASSPLEMQTADFINALRQPSDNAKVKHKECLQQLRTILWSQDFLQALEDKKKGKSYPIEVDILLDVCYARFTESHNYSFCESLIDGVAELGLDKDDIELEEAEESKNPEDLIEAQYAAMKSAPGSVKTFTTKFLWSKLVGEVGLNFDSHYQGNIPYVLYDLSLKNLEGEKKTVRALRFGSPTIEYTPLNCWVNPEFRTFLHAVQAKNQKHLYISFQRTYGTEKNRTEALMALQQEFPETFQFCVIAQDSEWYKQKGLFEKLDNAQEFKNEFYKQLMEDSNSGYYFPQAWKQDPRFVQAVQQFLESTHQDFFAGKDTLSLQERQDFIEWYNASLELWIIRYTEVSTFNMTCKDAVDRAGKENTKLFDLATALMGEENSQTRQKESKTIMLTPSFFAKKRVMIKAKKERLMQAKMRLKDGKVVQALQARQELYGIAPGEGAITMRKDEGQKISLKPQNNHPVKGASRGWGFSQWAFKS